jgi:hypothetical protein
MELNNEVIVTFTITHGTSSYMDLLGYCNSYNYIRRPSAECSEKAVKKITFCCLVSVMN